jgi:aspartyl/asparaginyl-tRNA synthetase
MKETINYNLLNKALKYFSKKGFKQVEVPWRVSKEAIEGTFKSSESLKSDDKFLIGSAEQGFLELYLQNKLTSNQLMSVSPCFRNGSEDYFHQQEFIKLELIYFNNYQISYSDIIQYQVFKRFVLSFIIKKLKIKSSDIIVIKTNDSRSIYSEDIMINGVEYGSYGIREFQGSYYIYGTGIALPRASKIIKGLKENEC